jgi:hypothetical protein
MLQHFPVAAVTMLAERIAQEQREGNIPAGIEPRLAFLSIAGAAMLPLSVRSLWSRMPGLATLTDAQLERHALTLLTAGLAPAIPGRRQSS